MSERNIKGIKTKQNQRIYKRLIKVPKVIMGVEHAEMSVISKLSCSKLRSSYAKSNFLLWIKYLIFQEFCIGETFSTIPK